MAVATWRYAVPNEGYGKEWAILFLDEICCFSVLSDWGDYSYRWSLSGMPNGTSFREFLLDCDDTYLLGKLSPKREYDGQETLKAAKKYICEERRHLRLTREDARECWDLFRRHSELHAREDFAAWVNDLDGQLDGAYELYCTSSSPHARNFMQKCWPRLKELIRADLQKEKEAKDQE